MRYIPIAAQNGVLTVIPDMATFTGLFCYSVRQKHGKLLELKADESIDDLLIDADAGEAYD